MAAAMDASEGCEPTVQHILEHKTLKWIFVGGKGGVGKTTCSSSLAVQLARVRESVLLVSTDPAHNLSDAFDQKFSGEPTLVKGFNNLFALEIDPEALMEGGIRSMASSSGPLKDLMSTIGSSIPGIDEATSFMQMLRLVEKHSFSVVVFDTAPTGHTLRLLHMPDMLPKSLSKITGARASMGGMLSQLSAMMGMDEDVDMTGSLQGLSDSAQKINAQFRDPDLTTFVCVCIAEFLSLYETERLVQELARLGFDVCTIIVNQLVNPAGECGLCHARAAIQHKYLGQMRDLYDDFHLVCLPLLPREVRGPEAISQFSELLLTPASFNPPNAAAAAAQPPA